MNLTNTLKSESGIVLVAGLMMLALLLIIGATAYMLSTTDSRISANYKYSEDAFANAEAGLDFAKVAIEADLNAGGYLPSTIGGTKTIPGSAPSGFSFSFSQLTRTGINAYEFTSTGSGPQGATASIKAAFKRQPAFDYAVFGDKEIDLKNSTGVFSYNSTDGLPDPGDPGWTNDLTDSTHNGDVGSNGEDGQDIILNSGSIVDGDVAQGAHGSPLVEAGVKDTGGLVTGDTESIGPVDPDPLNIAGDTDFLNKFANYDDPGENDNDLVSPLSSGKDLDTTPTIDTTDGDETLISQSGTTTNYYFDEIHLGNSQTLTIDATNGDINIWVRGRVLGDNGSEFAFLGTDTNKVIINVTEPSGGCGCATIIDFKNGGDFNPGGTPANLMIKTDSDETVSIHNGNDTRAVIYAPFAAVDFDNGAAYYGAVIGSTVTLRNSMKVYFDEAIKDGFQSNEVDFTTWEQVLN